MHELFPAFICAKNIGSLNNKLFGVKIFNPVAIFFLLSRDFNFALSAIVSSGSYFTSSSSSSGDISSSSSSSSKYKSGVNCLGLFRTFIFFL